MQQSRVSGGLFLPYNQIFFYTEFTFSNKRSLYKKRPWVLYEKSLIGMLYQTVMDARAGSQEAAEYLLNRFSPLLYG